MNFDIAAEEMRRLDHEPNEDEKLQLYGLYKQAIHGNIPSSEDYPKPPDTDQWNLCKYNAWVKNKEASACKKERNSSKLCHRSRNMSDSKNLRTFTIKLSKCLGKDRQQCEKEYIHIAEEMLKKYGRRIVRCKWNSEVWTVDY
uniref:ACB domain-containing protein n=1 Tax=Setaria digitata TaxID=48799 RepID=A0A915PWJ2_9BILA